MAREVAFILDDILDMIAAIEDLLSARTRDEIEGELMVHLGLHRAIEIISEASKHIPQDMQQAFPDIPWKAIRGMGNVLRHEYHRIADDVIWDVIEHDLPPLKASIAMLKARLQEN